MASGFAGVSISHATGINAMHRLALQCRTRRQANRSNNRRKPKAAVSRAVGAVCLVTVSRVHHRSPHCRKASAVRNRHPSKGSFRTDPSCLDVSRYGGRQGGGRKLRIVTVACKRYYCRERRGILWACRRRRANSRRQSPLRHESNINNNNHPRVMPCASCWFPRSSTA